MRGVCGASDVPERHRAAAARATDLLTLRHSLAPRRRRCRAPSHKPPTTVCSHGCVPGCGGVLGALQVLLWAPRGQHAVPQTCGRVLGLPLVPVAGPGQPCAPAAAPAAAALFSRGRGWAAAPVAPRGCRRQSSGAAPLCTGRRRANVLAAANRSPRGAPRRRPGPAAAATPPQFLQRCRIQPAAAAAACRSCLAALVPAAARLVWGGRAPAHLLPNRTRRWRRGQPIDCLWFHLTSLHTSPHLTLVSVLLPRPHPQPPSPSPHTPNKKKTGGGFLDYIRPVMFLLPEVPAPERKVCVVRTRNLALPVSSSSPAPRRLTLCRCNSARSSCGRPSRCLSSSSAARYIYARNRASAKHMRHVTRSY